MRLCDSFVRYCVILYGNVNGLCVLVCVVYCVCGLCVMYCVFACVVELSVCPVCFIL